MRIIEEKTNDRNKKTNSRMIRNASKSVMSRLGESRKINESRYGNIQKDIIENVKDEFEYGTSPIESYEEFKEYYPNCRPRHYDFYCQLIDMGPEGFYEEFKDELEFSDDFINEYGFEDDEDYDEDDLDESKKSKHFKKMNEDKNYSDSRRFIYELDFRDQVMRDFENFINNELELWKNSEEDMRPYTLKSYIMRELHRQGY